jgi:hypothetical protein
MFEAQKCHLSESVTDQSLLTIESELSMPRYDIAREFCLKGRILVGIPLIPKE